MRKKLLFLTLLLSVLLLSACSQQPPQALIRQSPEDSGQISAEPAETTRLQLGSTLYFRYGDTPLLRQETRTIQMLPNITREKAMVEALLEGSTEPGSLSLFPDKTQVISTQAQDRILYVTFSEGLYGGYADEGVSLEEAVLRRRMALAALTATLTESGEYAAVQVLVRAEESVGQSMRLTNAFLLEEGSETLPPLTRMQEYLPTPSAYAGQLLKAWAQRDPEEMGLYLTPQNQDQAASLPILLSYTVNDGTLSPDGSSALVCADLTLRDKDGTETEITACPLRMLRQNGAWITDLDQLRTILGETI
ncbi:MAG: GerMN domain-containing protein [Clostridia bacterium]|nr:GerMN domain-containing protein [Clostridia bacterium]